MTNPFSNMSPDEWPEGLTPEEEEDIFRLVNEVETMKEASDE